MMVFQHFSRMGKKNRGLFVAALVVSALFVLAGCDLLFPATTTTTTTTSTSTTTTTTTTTTLPFIGMIVIPGGSFQMGSPDGTGRIEEQPEHTVTLTGFRMSEYEVTQAQYFAIVGHNPSDFISELDAPECPVETVTWYDAVEFCNKLSQDSGYQPVYTITGRTPVTGYPITSATVTYDMTRNGFRLPTEAEWEYAARGGNGSPGGYTYSGSDTIDAVAWYESNSSSRTRPVGGKTANALGLYDMSGNVWEWCQDLSGAYESGTQNNPVGASSGSERVSRGGSWINNVEPCESVYRNSFGSSAWASVLGFRLARRP